MGCPSGNRHFEIAAHAHAERRRSVRRCAMLAQTGRNAVPGSSCGGRNAHQPDDGELQFVAAQGDEGRSASAGRTPAFCGSAPVLIWMKQAGAWPGAVISSARMCGPVFPGRRFRSTSNSRPRPRSCWSAADRSGADSMSPCEPAQRRPFRRPLPARGFRRKAAGRPPAREDIRRASSSWKRRPAHGSRIAAGLPRAPRRCARRTTARRAEPNSILRSHDRRMM